ncbi:hypothetical protein BC827DRAFT_1122126, partial [Russula dissimulans]
KKRSADEANVATRGDRAKRRESTGSGKDTRGPKTIPVSEFKAGAVPLHVTVTRTSPAIEDNNNGAVDPGFLGVVALQPCTFTTGSYGWKGGKRLVIDVVNPISDEKKTVQVMLTINATVMGSKLGAGGKEAEVEVEVDSTTSDANAIEDEAVEVTD